MAVSACLGAQRIASSMTTTLQTDTRRMSQPKPITLRPPPILPSHDSTQIPPNHGNSHAICRHPN
jgi:hypothetical protein